MKKTARNVRPLRGMPSSHGFGRKSNFAEGETTLGSLKMGQLGKIIAGKLVLMYLKKRALATSSEWKISTD